MELILRRETAIADSTPGRLFVDGEFCCFTLEDIIRPDGEKVFGKTAIPSGHFQVVINQSVHFGKMLPLLLDVPNFSGVRIHAGNSPEDTDGCILIGLIRRENRILQSQAAMALFFPKLQAGLLTGQCWITIYNPEISTQ